jgi:hypothetical protein
MYTENNGAKSFYALLGLFRQQWGANTTKASRLLPIYDYRKKEHFLSPLFGWMHGSNGFFYPFTPLAGIWTGASHGAWIFPLWSQRNYPNSDNFSGTFLWGRYWHKDGESGSRFFPLYSYKNYGKKPDTPPDDGYRVTYGKSFWSLPICWYSNITTPPSPIQSVSAKSTPGDAWKNTKSHGIFPLWSSSRTEYTYPDNSTEINAQGSLLLFLYDYKHSKSKATGNTPANDYTRRRILWHVWHYERRNGNVSVDIFPAITYDKKTNGFHKFSFLWHLLRYENGPKAKKLDILFIPIIRKNK